MEKAEYHLKEQTMINFGLTRNMVKIEFHPRKKKQRRMKKTKFCLTTRKEVKNEEHPENRAQRSVPFMVPTR